MEDSNEKQRVSRRRFLENTSKVGAGVAVAPLVLNLTACGSDGEPAKGGEPSAGGSAPKAKVDGTSSANTRTIAGTGTIAAGAVLLGLYPGDGEAAMTAAAERLDFSWLGEGESVLIKVASNSSLPHPATTSPSGVRGMVKALKARGAGRVIVADQAGVEWVRRTETGRFSSTREMFMGNGLVTLESDAELHFFDDGEWDSGYFEATLPEGHRWPRGLRIASVVRDVDHIIYMPRISAHLLAGLTHGQKSAIGWLRDDSRNDVHRDAADFYEKYTEINYVEEIASRFRMAVTVSEQVQLFGGPDRGTAYTMDPPLVLASTRLANHDAMACSLLSALQKVSGAEPSGMRYQPGSAPLVNGAFAGGAGVGGTDGAAGPWKSEAPTSMYEAHPFDTSVSGDRSVARGWELSGGKPSQVEVVADGQALAEDLRESVESHGDGLYTFA